MSLSITADVRALTDGSQYRGIGTYLTEILSGLAATEFAVYARGGSAAQLPTGVVYRPRVRITRTSSDVYFSPAQSPPRRRREPWVQTLHDLTPLVFRDPLLERDRKRWLQLGPRIRRAQAVICPSQSSAQQGIELLGLDPAILRVIPHGVSPDFQPAKRKGTAEYLLMVSAWGPHKGFSECLTLMDRLAAAGRPHRLKIIGPKDDWSRAQVSQLITQMRHPERVELMGYVAHPCEVYQQAAALVVTSRAEGFGLPVLEAQASGCPVISFDNTSLPEAVGEAGLLVRDGDVDELALGVERLLDDRLLRDRIISAGVARAAEFTWHRAVQAHADVFRSVAS